MGVLAASVRGHKSLKDSRHSESHDQEGLPLGQEGRVHVARPPALFAAAPGQADREMALAAPAKLGQEGQGLAVRGCTHPGELQGQEGHELIWPVEPSHAKVMAVAAGHNGCPTG